MLKKNPRDARYNDPEEALAEEMPRPAATVAFTAAPEVRPTPAFEGTMTRRPVEPPVEAPAVRAAPAPAPANESLIDARSTFDGRFESEHDLRVEGTVIGEVVCGGRITVEREATARARIEARDGLIRGRLDGDIMCAGQLIIAGTAVVTGTIRAASLVVEEGASLKGSVEASTAATLPPAAGANGRSAATEIETGGQAPRAFGEEAAPRPSRAREVPSFALVSSEERPARNGT
jgi:cytoskeletal protein CcmA (bactofilin family)